MRSIGFEPTTHSLGGNRSIQTELRAHKINIKAGYKNLTLGILDVFYTQDNI